MSDTTTRKDLHVDALVLMKVVRHCQENLPELVTGQLLGMEKEERLEVTHSFPFAVKTEDTRTPGQAAGNYPTRDPRDPYKPLPTESDDTEYHAEMMRHLREVNVDCFAVGWYLCANLGGFLTDTTVATQFEFQEGLPGCVMLVYDPAKSQQGSLSVAAYRLTDQFMALYREKAYTMSALKEAGVGAEDIYERVPIKLVASQLAKAMLIGMGGMPEFSCDHERLTFGSNPYLEKNMVSLIDAVDELHQKQNNIQHYYRNYTKNKAYIANALARRRQENAERRARGEEELPESDIIAQQRVLNEPSRLESLIVSSQIGEHCRQLNEFAGQSFSRLFLASRFLQQPKAAAK